MNGIASLILSSMLILPFFAIGLLMVYSAFKRESKPYESHEDMPKDEPKVKPKFKAGDDVYIVLRNVKKCIRAKVVYVDKRDDCLVQYRIEPNVIITTAYNAKDMIHV